MISTLRFASSMLIVGVLYPLSASIILLSPVELGGTGLGTVTTVLTFTSPGSSTIETGCVAPNGSGTTTLGCGFTDSNVQNGAGQIGTPTLAAAGITAAADLRIVFNASEPGGASDITLNNLVLTLYSGANTFLAALSPAGGIFFPTSQSGTGNSGFVFALASPTLCTVIGGCPAGTDTTEAAAAQAFINSNGGPGNIRIGLGASAGVAAGGSGSATGGLETFFVGSVASTGGPRSAPPPVPEPAVYLLIGTGLLALARIRGR